MSSLRRTSGCELRTTLGSYPAPDPARQVTLRHMVTGSPRRLLSNARENSQQWMGARVSRRGRAAREMVVVVLVLLSLALLFSPYLLQRRVASRRQFCEFRQIELATAMMRYEAAWGHFPGYRGALFSVGPAAAAGHEIEASPPIGWVYSILPYLEVPRDQLTADSVSYQQVFDRHGPAGPPESRGNIPDIFLPHLLCPEDPRQEGPKKRPLTSFIANTGMPDAPATELGPFDWPANGILLDAYAAPKFPVSPLSLELLNTGDGAENTLMISENLDNGLWTDHEEARVGFLWVPHFVDGQPDPGDELLRINREVGKGDGTSRFARPSSRHPGGVNAIFASGRTQFLSQDMDYLVYAHLMTSDTFRIMIPGTERLVDPPYRSEMPPAASSTTHAARGTTARFCLGTVNLTPRLNDLLDNVLQRETWHMLDQTP
jgi:hypothetical protein